MGDTRQRAIEWLTKKQDRPAAQDAQSLEKANADEAAAPTAMEGPAAAPRTRGRTRGRQPQDSLGGLLATDATSQRYAEQLWWKFTHYYLPAKRLDIQRRRGLASGDTISDEMDVDADRT
jgi:hypothetical protein